MKNTKRIIKVKWKNALNEDLENKHLFKVKKEEFEEKDIVFVQIHGTIHLGIVVEDDVDLDELLNINFKQLDQNEVKFVCKSTHDITSSRNEVLKSALAIFDVSLYELNGIYNNYHKYDSILIKEKGDINE